MILGENVYYQGQAQKPILWLLGDSRAPDDVVKHYFVGPSKGKGFINEIKSYSDLQKYSLNGRPGRVGHENYVYHLKERIPAAVRYDDGSMTGAFGSWVNYGPKYWAPDSEFAGYNLRGHFNGYEDTILGSWGDGTYYTTIRHHFSRIFPEAHTIVSLSMSTSQNLKNPSVVPGISAGYFATGDAFLGSLDLSTILEHASDTGYWYPMFSGTPTIITGRNYDRVLAQMKSCSFFSEDSLFDPKLDLFELQDKHFPPTGLESHLASQALSATSFDSNSIANAMELFDLAKSIKSGKAFTELWDSLKSLKSTPMSSLGDAWLKYRYAINTTLADINEFKDYATAGEPTVMRASSSSSAGAMHIKIRVAPKSNQIGRLVNSLTELGVAPNLYNLWDLIPFSFVADWFIHFGDFLEDLTQYGRVAAYDVLSCTTSWKWVDVITKGHTTAEYEYYQREVSSAAPSFVPYVEQSSTTRTNVKRLADTVALIS
jgi:hypothetical protein